MKKFSTIASILAVSLPLMSAEVFAAGAQATTAQAQAIASKSKCEFLPDAPDKHVVVRGDTLWGISSIFLKNPWCWPVVWGMNQEEIRNPHWIYPGQIVYFDRANGRLRLGNPGGIQTEKWTPRSRNQGLGDNAIPAIPASVIEPFLSQPLIVEKNELASAPRIIGTKEGRVNLGQGEKAYVRGDLDGGTSFQVFRPGVPLLDPETKAIIGYEAVYLGTVKLDKEADDEVSDVHTFLVVNSKEEMAVGDRLMPIPPSPILNYVPHAPKDEVDARVVAVYGGVGVAGQNQIISINRGKDDGLNIGTVLTLFNYGPVIVDKTDNNKRVKLPDEKIGHLFIFRVFDNISYGLIMQVTDVVKIGDAARSPK
ncbi:LysM peptidoglycan-binding domain-containing protein [Undibacterium sp. Ji49W]|uniref:LysM peptidoglycan-binding domain-containing protein n=1 Tax=Undibacterium sp. Ji49W TaxID=3413040 RepID=UPI003BEF8ED0